MVICVMERACPAQPSSQEHLSSNKVIAISPVKESVFFVALPNCTLESGLTKSSFGVYLGTQVQSGHLINISHQPVGLVLCGSRRDWVLLPHEPAVMGAL